MGVAAIAAVGWGGTAISHKMKCADLREDFVNSFHAMSTDGNLKLLSKSPNDSLEQAAERIESINKERSEILIERLAVECGERSTQTAIREAAQAIGM